MERLDDDPSARAPPPPAPAQASWKARSPPRKSGRLSRLSSVTMPTQPSRPGREVPREAPPCRRRPGRADRVRETVSLREAPRDGRLDALRIPAEGRQSMAAAVRTPLRQRLASSRRAGSGASSIPATTPAARRSRRSAGVRRTPDRGGRRPPRATRSTRRPRRDHLLDAAGERQGEGVMSAGCRGCRR